MAKGEGVNWKPIVIGVVAVAGVAVAYFGIIRPITNALGLTDSKDDRLADKLKDEDALNPELSEKRPNRVTITTAEAKKLASTIYHSKGYLFNDAETERDGAIRRAGSKYNMSFVSKVFFDTYNRDLLTYLESYSNSTELANIRTIINNY